MNLSYPIRRRLEGLEKLCIERIHDSQVLSQTRDALFEAFRSKSKSLSLDSYGMKDDTDIPLEKLINILSRGHRDTRSSADVKDKAGNQLPNIIVSVVIPLPCIFRQLTDTAIPFLLPFIV